MRKLHPQTSRIIISGFTDQAEAADSLNCTHLFIPKPFDVKMLRATLARIGSLDAYLKDDKLRGLAGKMRTLPSFPTLYLEIMREIESPNSSIQGIANIVAKDPGITAKILQVANSAAVGLPEKVSDPVDAVQQLGMTTVRSLVLSAQVYGSYAPGRLKNFSADALWTHLMKCGDLARTIMRRERAEFAETEDAFTAGMLHDMGKLMLADSLPAGICPGLGTRGGRENIAGRGGTGNFWRDPCRPGCVSVWLVGIARRHRRSRGFSSPPEKSDLKKCSALTAVHVANAL